MLPSPQVKFAANPHLSGKNGGHTINLSQFTRDGIILLGRIRSASNQLVWLNPDLKESLAKVDKFEADILKLIDDYIARSGDDIPTESVPILRDAYDQEEITELDLEAAGITSIIWANGYRFDFSMVKLPVFDGDGYPIQKRGVTEYPGLYFVGLPWLYKPKSGLLVGVGEHADYVASAIDAAANGHRR